MMRARDVLAEDDWAGLASAWKRPRGGRHTRASAASASSATHGITSALATSLMEDCRLGAFDASQ
eukprot:6201022-Alexandrium_andersonii.AAC.1